MSMSNAVLLSVGRERSYRGPTTQRADLLSVFHLHPLVAASIVIRRRKERISRHSEMQSLLGSLTASNPSRKDSFLPLFSFSSDVFLSRLQFRACKKELFTSSHRPEIPKLNTLEPDP